MKNPWNIEPDPWVVVRGIAPLPTIGGSGAAQHPILASAFLGAAGGAAGAIAAAIIGFALGMVFGEALFGTPDFGEGLGLLLGLHCVVMFPIGGGVLGAIPSVILGWIRASREEPLNAPLAALTGFVTVLLLTAAAIATLILFVPG